MASDSYKEFLHDYLEKHEVPVGHDGVLPFRLFTHSIKHDELEGECIDLALQHLKSSLCPDNLAFLLVRKVTDDVMNGDLSATIKQNEAEDKSYDMTALARLIFASLHGLCRVWNDKLPLFVLEQQMPPQCSEYGIKNTRRKMEDRHCVITNLNLLLGIKDRPLIQWYAVYDGHGGLDASNYASKQLHLKIAKEDGFYGNMTESLKSSIQAVDDDFCSKAKDERMRSGTTAVVAAIVEQTLHLAWVGDSQAVLVKDGKPITIMNPHKPEREDEKKRIEELGGCVVWFGAWRVNGSLSVSRAIGDADHKPYVSGEADTTTLPLDGTEDFLCLACDGFWDVFNGEDLVRLVRDHLKESDDKNTVARTLCLKAKSEGSTDNITVLVVFLRDNIKLCEDSKPPADASNLTMEDNDPPSHLNTNDNANNNNNHIGNATKQPTESLRVLQGLQMELAHKHKIPHKLLVNFVRNQEQKKVDKGAVIVTKSSPHLKLPHTLHNRRLGSQQISPMLRRRDTRGSLLSLSTIESVTDLSLNETKSCCDKKSRFELPMINDTMNKSMHGRLSAASSPFEIESSRKPLGHRAPSVQTRGRSRAVYRASLVVTCQEGNSGSQSLNGGYSRSTPDDLHNLVPYDKGLQNTEIAITNSLSPSLKPRHQKKYMPRNRRIVKLVYRGRRRSRSAF